MPRSSAEDQLHVREPATGTDFDTVQRFWVGEAFRCLGAAVRSKKVAFLGVKVYAAALYVEAEKAARELGVRSRGGFFSNDDDFCLALMDGAFHKALQIRMARKVDGAQFVEAFEEALTPRLTLMGELKSLSDLRGFFQARSLDKGTDVLLLWRQEGALEVGVRPPGTPPDYQKATPDLRIESAGMCRALFEVYMGSKPVIPEAKAEWARGARALLETEEVRRATRKSGGS